MNDSSTKVMKVICGNDKILKRFNIDTSFNNFDVNIKMLEK